MSVYIIPFFVIFVFIYAKRKKVDTFKTFGEGAKKSIFLIFDIFPTLVGIFVMLSVMKVSGVDVFLAKALSPVLELIGIPKDLSLLVILRPFSGSGCLAILQDIYTKFGPDSYVSRAASVIMSASDTLFYITTLYLTQTKVKKLLWTIPIGLLVCIFSSIVGCLACKVF